MRNIGYVRLLLVAKAVAVEVVEVIRGYVFMKRLFLVPDKYFESCSLKSFDMNKAVKLKQLN